MYMYACAYISASIYIVGPSNPIQTYNDQTIRAQVILRERPLVALQSLDNRQYVPCCGGCFHFLGSARHHLLARMDGWMDGGRKMGGLN